MTTSLWNMEAHFEDEELLAEAGWLRRLAHALVRDEAEAEDLCQETLLAALRSGTRPHSGWRAWLRGTLLRRRASLARAEVRRRRREARVAQDESRSPEGDWLETAEAFESVLRELRRLPPQLGETVLMRYFHDWSVEQIAERQGVAPGTVRSRLQRARTQLRARLHFRFGGPSWLSALILLPRVPAKSTLTWSTMKTGTQATLALALAATLTVALMWPTQSGPATRLGKGWEAKTVTSAVERAAAQAEFAALEAAAREAAREEIETPSLEGATADTITPPPIDAVALGGRGSLVLTLLDSANGRPVESGRVRVLGESSFVDQAFLQSPLQLELPEGEHELLVQALGFEPLLLQGVQVVAQEVTPLGAHVLERGTASIEGAVLFGDERLAAGRIELHGAGRQACPDCDQTDGLIVCMSCGFAIDRSEQALAADRDFAFDGLCAGEYLLVAYDLNDTVVAHRKLELARGEPVRVDLALAFFDLPIRLTDANGAPFRGVWVEEGQPYSNPVRLLCSDHGVLTGRATWNPPGRFEQNGVTYFRENESDPNAHILRMQLLGVDDSRGERRIPPVENAREILLSPKLPSPLPKLRTSLLTVKEQQPDVFVLLRVPTQTRRLDVSCGPFMESMQFDLSDWDGKPIEVQMRQRCGAGTMMLEQAVSCSDCHRMPG